jgi:hypothetical protein
MTLEAWNTRMHHRFKFIKKIKLRLPNHMLYEYCMSMEASASD